VLLTERILELAREEGFDLAGVAPLEPPRDASRFEAWLAAGHHGSMRYLARNKERILEPQRILPEARSMLVVGMAHSRPAGEIEGGGRVARYALGQDYHNRMTRKLRRLARRIAEASGLAPSRAIVDAGPLLERSHAAEAGLGFASKAANLLHPAFGPWFFLGELLLPIELEPTPAPRMGSCGTCTACLDACPTGAILEPGLVDAPRCISYQTIEQRGPIPRELRPAIGEWAFGCDVCSEVCPWGREAPDRSAEWGTHPAVEAGLVSWVLADEPFETRFPGSPVRRARREGLARNAAIVLGNVPSDAGRVALLRVLAEDPAALVREAAGWALARGHGRDHGVRLALEAAAGREPDPQAKRELELSLEEHT
jgi:epoxyqueuosine reductase